MTIRVPEPPSTGLLAIAAVFLNIGLAALVTGSPFFFELVMGVMTLAVGAVLSAIFQPWRWWEEKE
jgi:hypothetical protein